MRPWYKRGLPGWIVSGAGGGGLSTVSVTPRLIGNGTSGSPLDIAGWPQPFYSSGIQSGTNARNGVNQVSVGGCFIVAPVTFSHISVFVGTADAVNNYDLGIYNQSGTLIANVGAQPLPTTNAITLATVQGAKTILPGLYVFGWTGNATTATLGISGNFWGWLFNQNIAASVGGALPASIGALTVTPTINQWYFALS